MSDPPDRSIVSFHRTFYMMPQKRTLRDSESVFHQPTSYFERSTESTNADSTNNSASSEDLLRYINNNIIGKDRTFRGPFGDRKTVYCDWTASGKSLHFIEDFIQSEVLPTYGNTHTTTNVTSLQTTMFRHEAKDIIRNAVRASEDDAVIFVGSGCTGAIHKLIHNLNLEQPPIVIVGPFEHHSNILPWRHLASKVCRAKTDSSGTVSLKSLEKLLSTESVNAQELGCKLIVCMAAASNVTGILVDVDAFSSLIHRYGALAFWDYATAAPYVKIDMNPISTNPKLDRIHKDAVYFSMHKFVGGPQTPGVLVAKRVLFRAGEKQPSGCGGGTVFFVRREGQLYLKDVEEREEGGTPAIVESIRAGLVMQLKEAVTVATIMQREESLVHRIWSRLADCPNIVVLGGKDARRLPIISVVIRHVYPTPGTASDESSAACLFLHHNFVSALLNDLFGIQSRGGCACAGPYAMDLLGIDEALAKLYEESLVGCRLQDFRHPRFADASSRELLRPGFVRLSLPFFFTDAEVDFILDAVKFVAANGWAFLPLYRYNAATGEWIHRHHDPSHDRRWLSNVQYHGGRMSWVSADLGDCIPAPDNFEACLTAAQDELCKAVSEIVSSTSLPVPDDTDYFAEIDRELRWFLLPSEAAAQIRNEMAHLAISTPNSAPWHPGTLSSCFCPDLQSKAVQPTSKPDRLPSPLGIRSELQLRVPLTVRHITRSTSSIQITEVKTNVKQPESSIPRSQSEEHLVSTIPPLRVVKLEAAQRLSVKMSSSHAGLTDEDRNKIQPSSNNSACIPAACHRRPQTKNNQQKTEKPKTAAVAKLSKQYDRISLKVPNTLWRTPPKILYKLILRAIRTFDMIHPGDRVLVCLSGGKDSLSLLHCLHQYQFMLRSAGQENSFELGAVTVDPGSTAYDPSPLIPYLAALGVPYYFEKQGIIRQATELPYELSSICSFCSRMKRGRIYACARENGYNVIALGQHLDDIVESFLMSCFHNGILLTMKANYTIRQGDLRVIRPLAFVRETETRKFAEVSSLPVIPENCPACFIAPKERFRIKRMLAEQEVLFPEIYSHLRRALLPLISENRTRSPKTN